MALIYLIGSLRNPEIPGLGHSLRDEGWDVFDDWFAAGPEADDYWQKYETEKGSTYGEALEGWAAEHVFAFDKHHLLRSDIGLLVLPTGKSGHLEMGWMLGQGKRGYIYFPEGEPDRWDVMYQFADGVAFDFDVLIDMMRRDKDVNV